jgi:hypothetical protein
MQSIVTRDKALTTVSALDFDAASRKTRAYKHKIRVDISCTADIIAKHCTCDTQEPKQSTFTDTSEIEIVAHPPKWHGDTHDHLELVEDHAQHDYQEKSYLTPLL